MQVHVITQDMVGLSHLLSSSRIIRSVRFMKFPSKENHGLLKLQLVQTIMVMLHCKQFEQNGIIAAYLSSWRYSVTEGCGWVVLSVADLERVPWVPCNPSFEELASKILRANILRQAHTAPSAARDGDMLSV